MSSKNFIKADEVAQELEVSKPYAYKLVRELNDELKKNGFITISGRVSRQYFEEKFYGLKKAN
jgi:DNA-binding IscR family transcriptional regulator